MNIDKPGWKAIEEELKSLFCHVSFQYQGVVISVNRERVSENRSQLFVYFNNKVCLAWGDKGHDMYNPLTELFWRTVTRPLYSKTRIAEVEKLLGKRHAKKELPYIYKTHTYLSPGFINAVQLIRQYKKIAGLEWINKSEISQ
ncbi:hypothetical protein EAE91_18085 [Photorhabdus noenieputensis]|uniref:hypothetical protein n=1 Tax=Photorhabdus noenieputensis TaxID=1208607 RepID=UPI001BD23BC7|nr:hypothetical protein [Photorhabdus noenieputensis]MBS9438970.1 hypothetical protein [Photorhabdus noenieputensis]MCK3669740.1 hypothetical protein [Photorhabdus noenieputensis]